jgi:hypothetical protein
VRPVVAQAEVLLVELKVPTVALPAEVVLTDGRTLTGRIFLPASASRHTGATRAEEWMEEPNAFFPFLIDGGEAPAILNKRQVLLLSVPFAVERDAPGREEDEVGVRRAVRLWCGEHELAGHVHIDMPENQSRVLDYLNRPGRFVGLWDGQRHVLIQKDLITRIQED